MNKNKKAQDLLVHARYLWGKVQQSGSDVGDALAELSKFLRENHFSLAGIGVTDFEVMQAKFNAYICGASRAVDLARRANSETEEYIDKMDLLLFRATNIFQHISDESSCLTLLRGVGVDASPTEIKLHPRKLIGITDEQVEFLRENGRRAHERLWKSRRRLNSLSV